MSKKTPPRATLSSRLAARIAREEAATTPAPVLASDPVWSKSRRIYRTPRLSEGTYACIGNGLWVRSGRRSAR